MSALPGLVRRLLDEEAWREFDAPPPGGHVEYASFRAFVEGKPPAGLGSRLGQLLALCGSNDDLRGRVQHLYDVEVLPAAAHGEIGNGRNRERDTNSIPMARSDTRERVVARLKRDHPDLAERVVSGEITANAAARQAGIRKPRVVLTSPESVARSLRKYMSPGDLAELIGLLGRPDTGTP